MSSAFFIVVVGSVGVFIGMSALYGAIKLLSLVVGKMEKGS